MSIIKHEDGTTVITGPHINLTQMLSQRAMLKLEIMGFKRGGRSIYSIIKGQYKIRGNRERVLEQFNTIIEEYKNEHPVNA